MGNRFGRNQKRRMREELASVELKLQMSKKLMATESALFGAKILKLEQDIREQREVVKLTEDVLSSYFASLPEKKLQLARKKGHDIIGWLQQWPQPSAPSRAHGDWDRCVESTVRAIQMIEMALLEGAAWAEEARNIIHLRYYFADGQSAYSVSRQALRHLTKDHLQTTVAKECAELLVTELSDRGHR